MKYRTGKIARLPKDLRDRVNAMLDDGVPYKTILAELDARRDRWPPGLTGINKMNLTHWKEGGYQDWRREREIREQTQIDRQSALDYLKETHGNDVRKALPEVLRFQVLELLMRTDPRDMADALNNPNSLSRLLNSFVRLKKGV